MTGNISSCQIAHFPGRAPFLFYKDRILSPAFPETALNGRVCISDTLPAGHLYCLSDHPGGCCQNDPVREEDRQQEDPRMENMQSFRSPGLFQIFPAQDRRDDTCQQNSRQRRSGCGPRNEDPPDLAVVDPGKLLLCRSDRIQKSQLPDIARHGNLQYIMAQEEYAAQNDDRPRTAIP